MSAPVQSRALPDDSVPDELVGYRGQRLPDRRNHHRQLDYWVHLTGCASIRSAAGSGNQRLALVQDILVSKIVKRLLDTGISLHSIRVAVDHCVSAACRTRPASPCSGGTTVTVHLRQVVDLLPGRPGCVRHRGQRSHA